MEQRQVGAECHRSRRENLKEPAASSGSASLATGGTSSSLPRACRSGRSQNQVSPPFASTRRKSKNAWEAQCALSLLRLVSVGFRTECGSTGARDGQQPHHDFSPLPRTHNTKGSEEVVEPWSSRYGMIRATGFPVQSSLARSAKLQSAKFLRYPRSMLPESTDEQQSSGLPRQRQRGSVDARRHWAARILDGDAPEIADPEGEKPCLRQRNVV